MVEKKEKQVERYELVQVPTKTEIAFRDNTMENEEEKLKDYLLGLKFLKENC